MRLLFSVLLAAACAAAASGAANAPTQPPTGAFAQDEALLSWVEAPPGSKVHVEAAGGGADHVVGTVAGAGGRLWLALAGRRAVWAEETFTMRHEVDIETAAIGGRARPLELLAQSVTEDDASGEYLADLAGDGSSLVYSVVAIDADCPGDHGCENTVAGGRLVLVRPDGSTAVVPRVPPAVRLAVASDLVAVVPARPGSVARAGLDAEADRLVELHRLPSGRLVARLALAAPPADVALSTTTLAVLTAGRITLYATGTGRLLSSTPVAANAADLSVSAAGVVYRAGKTIRLLGRAAPLAVAASLPIGLSIEDTRVGWAENTATGGRIRLLSVRQRR